MTQRDGHVTPGSVRTIDVRDLRARLDSGTVPQVVDVREGWEWAQGHLMGASHMPLGDLPARLGELAPERPVVFICHLGVRSEMAARLAVSQGLLDVSNVEGGMDAWEHHGYPVEADARP